VQPALPDHRQQPLRFPADPRRGTGQGADAGRAQDHGMKHLLAVAALALWVLVANAQAQMPVAFDYRCDAAAATTTPAALPADGW
jgi:hypothetical protein